MSQSAKQNPEKKQNDIQKIKLPVYREAFGFVSKVQNWIIGSSGLLSENQSKAW